MPQQRVHAPCNYGLHLEEIVATLIEKCRLLRGYVDRITVWLRLASNGGCKKVFLVTTGGTQEHETFTPQHNTGEYNKTVLKTRLRSEKYSG